VGLAFWILPLAAVALALGPAHVLSQVGLFFSKVAVVSFGGAYAVLAYVAQHAVEAQGWLSPAEMVDGLGLAETTPGPLIQVLQFVAFLAAWRDAAPFAPEFAALLASVIATWATFAPSFVWIFTGAPWVDRAAGAAAARGGAGRSRCGGGGRGVEPVALVRPARRIRPGGGQPLRTAASIRPRLANC
jgi:chromate transporter